PGGPFDDEVALNPIVKEQLTQHWKIEQSWPEQALSYAGGILQGDLGVSMVRPERTVAEIIGQGLRNTFSLNLLALLIVVGGALFVALMSLRFKDTWFEELLDQAVITFLALPSLFWGPLLIYFFGFYFNLLPVAFLSSPAHYILPLLTLCLRPMAALIRILKNSLNENFRQDYVRTARAKGVGTWQILVHHVLKNSMIPFLSYLGPLLVSLFSGSFLVEVLFAIPGLGTEFVAALNDRDYTLIVGLTLFYGVLLIVVNSGLDVLTKYLDPRLREV
ncbi:MAG: ABC transporter permease, partial [Bdellovibrio sp.]|nr:ABC transporter permease [Bdellovibrio sp.]